MPVSWTPENERKFMLKIIHLVSNRDIDAAEFATHFPGATPRAIMEHLYVLRKEAKAIPAGPAIAADPAIPQVRSYGVTAKIKKVGEKKSKVMGAEIGKGGDGEQQAKKQRGRKRKASFDADAEGEGEWGGEGDATKVVKERKKGGSLSVKDQEVVVKMEISEDDDAEDGKGVVDADGA